MLITTRAIVLKALKYGETSLICEFLTEQQGLISGIVGGVRKMKARNAAVFVQPGSLLELTLYYNRNKNLHRIKEYKPAHVFRYLPFEVPRIAISQFMVELIQKSVKESEENLALFEFCFESILAIDQENLSTRYATILFAVELTRHLGFYPMNNWSPTSPYLNLIEGVFSDKFSSFENSLSRESSELIHRLLSQIENDERIDFSSQERNDLLDSLLLYYRNQLENFGTMNSPSIYRDVFYG